MEILIVVIVLTILVVAYFVMDAYVAEKRREELRAEARTFLSKIDQDQGLTPVATSLILKRGETAYFSGSADLYETRAVRHYVAGHSGVRIMKGVYVGGSKGKSVSSQEWTKVASGSVVVTNKRLLFDGDKNDRNIALNKIFNIESTADGVEVSCENRQKSMIFASRNPIILAIILRICCYAEDPAHLDESVQIEVG